MRVSCNILVLVLAVLLLSTGTYSNLTVLVVLYRYGVPASVWPYSTRYSNLTAIVAIQEQESDRDVPVRTGTVATGTGTRIYLYGHSVLDYEYSSNSTQYRDCTYVCTYLYCTCIVLYDDGDEMR